MSGARGSRGAASPRARLARACAPALTVLLAVACGQPAAPSAPAAARAPAWQVRAGGGQAPIDPGTSDLALLDAQECEGCHADEHEEWASSRHGLAWRNGIFWREYSAQPRAWCVNCHAPLLAQQQGLAEGDDRLASQGVSCAVCHVRRGQLVSARRRPGSPHQTVAEPSFGSPAMCADCHQFNFPVLSPQGGAVLAMTQHPMQSTVADFLSGPRAREPRGCLTCHGSDHGHAFRGGHDLEMLRRAIAASWCRSEGEVVVEIANVGAGHRVPTGDVHRHLLARVWRSTAPESIFEAYFGRRFRPAEDGGKETVWDSTLWPGQRRRFAVPEPSLRGAELATPDELADGSPQDAAEVAAEAAAEAAQREREALAEPLNFEVTYVYTLDEVPRAHNDPGEPVTAQILHERRPFLDLPACAATSAALTPR